MTLAQEIAASAHRIAVMDPDESTRLLGLAARVRRIEIALDELVTNAMEDDELVRQSTVVVRFPGRG